MDVVIEEVSSATRRMKFVLPGEDVDKEINQITREMVKKVSMPGFRKGRVPATVVKRKFGDQIQNDAIMTLVTDRVKAELSERGIEPIRQPYIENYTVADQSDDYEITVSYEVIPEVNDPTLTGEEMVNPIVELSETDIDEVIDRWHETHLAYESVDGPVVSGDRVTASIERFVDGESIWGQAQRVVLKTDDADADELREITDACLDKKIADKFSVTVVDTVLAEDAEEPVEVASESSQLETQIEVEVLSIDRPKPGELREEFLNHLGVTGVDDPDFRDRARAEIERVWQRERERIMRDQAMTLLFERNTFTPPESIVIRQVFEYLKANGLNEQQIAAEMQRGLESEMFGMMYPRVAADLKFSMIFDRIQSDRNIEFEEGEIETYLEDALPSTAAVSTQESEAVHQMMLDNIRRSGIAEYQRNKLIDAVLEDVDKKDQTMGLEEFEQWAQSVRKAMQPEPDQVLDVDQSVAAEPEEAASESDVSVIVDAAGNPIDKSKSE